MLGMVPRCIGCCRGVSRAALLAPIGVALSERSSNRVGGGGGAAAGASSKIVCGDCARRTCGMAGGRMSDAR